MFLMDRQGNFLRKKILSPENGIFVQIRRVSENLSAIDESLLILPPTWM
jgi:hypothetical protein